MLFKFVSLNIPIIAKLPSSNAAKEKPMESLGVEVIFVPS